MTALILSILLILIVFAIYFILIPYVIVKYVPLKFKPIINIVLLLLTLFLGYKIYNSIYAPVKFNKVKVERYAKVVEKLKDIRKAELAHRDVTGKYTNSFDNLVKFIDTASFVITQQRDSSFLVKERGITDTKDTVLIDTLGYAPVKDSLFKNDNRYKEMMWVPIPKKEKQVKFELKTGSVTRSNVAVPVFMARVAKREILYDQDKTLLKDEESIKSTKEINGEYVQVGSLSEANDSGNWPKLYDIGDEEK